MDRDTILNLSIKINMRNENSTTNEVNDIISSYCREMGKGYADIQLLLFSLYKNPVYLSHCFTWAFSYYERKFTICKLYGLIDSNPLNSQGQRKVLLIF